jgi:polar amino acid transport system substrate-binding protein
MSMIKVPNSVYQENQNHMKTLAWMFGIGIFCSIAFQGVAQEKTIRISTGEYAPWTSESSPHGGFMNHVITETFQREGYAVIYRYVPWKRAYEEAKDGDVQATSFWANDPDYLQDFYRSDPIATLPVVFFYLRSNPMRAWNTVTDLQGYRIGTMLGDTSSKLLKEAGLQVEEVATAEQNIKKLLSGRIDISPKELVLGLELLNTKFTSEERDLITYDPKPLFESPGHLMFSKHEEQAKELVTIFNRGLAKLRAEGRYEQLYQNLLAGKYRQQ